jgi:hypothetical protein
MHLYGTVETKVKEDAVIVRSEDGKANVGMEVYLVRVKLDRLIPTVISMQGKKK